MSLSIFFSMLSRGIKIAIFVMAFTLGPVAARSQDADTLLAQGLSLYQAGKTDEAIKILSDLLSQQPENSNVLYNLGLAQFKAGRVGSAMGLWRKALNIQPSLNEARVALEFAATKSSKSLSEGDGSFWDVYRDRVLARFSADAFIGCTLLLFLICGWLLLSYFGKRRRALQHQTALPQLPKMALLFSLLFALSLGSLISKTMDLLTVKATVIQPQVEAKTGPGADHAALFELGEGAAVTVKAVEKGWAQIRSLSGRVGWIPVESLFVTGGNQNW